MNDIANIPGHRIDRLLGKGGMAEVYLAEQLSLGRMVAVKIMDPHLGDQEFTDRFLQEARLVASMNHGSIITIYDFGKLPSGKLYLSMEYLGGGDLQQRLQQGVQEVFALKVLKELASGLRFVHSKGVVHRDIKPANILFRQDGSLVLTDFGIAKEINNDTGLTQAGMMVGSASYASPEQIQGLKVDLRTDIYSVGVLLIEMLTGHNPFKADTFINTAMNHLQMDIPQLPGHLARYQPLLDKMIAKKPDQRFANMEQLLLAMKALLSHTATNKVPAMSPPPVAAQPVPTASTTTSATAKTVSPAPAPRQPDTIRVPPVSTPATKPAAKPAAKQDPATEAALRLLRGEIGMADEADDGFADEFGDEARALLSESAKLLGSAPRRQTPTAKSPPATPATGKPAAAPRKPSATDDLFSEDDLKKARSLGNLDPLAPTSANRGGGWLRNRPIPDILRDDDED